MKTVVCTLFEGDYHLGVGALANSLYRFGYRGVIHAGYRGSAPVWLNGSEQAGPRDYNITDGLSFRVYPLETRWHLANWKPQFMKQVFAADPTIDAVCYFDPDIVIKCPWSFYEDWVQPGIALVEELVTRGMPYNHPIRVRWLEIANKLHIACHPKYSQYFNAGFVGMRRNCVRYLDDWEKVLTYLSENGFDMNSFMPMNRPDPFCGPDQDALNIMAMAAEPFLSTIGPEGMDFIPGGFTMSHAVGSPKPWRRNYLKTALQGMKPSLADKGFWENVASPIALYPSSLIGRRHVAIKVASLIGRFYHL
jgi:hypothetical protein